MTDRLVYDVKMNWISDSPHTEIRVSLLAYLRIRLRRIEQDDAQCEANDVTNDDPALAELPELRRWIAWLSGETVEVPG